jgi:adenosylhomocysteine nucleosidase
MAPIQCYTDAPCWAGLSTAGDEILLVETGLGQTRVDRALDWLLNLKIDGAIYRPKWLIFAGFAGALAPDLRVGDVVWGTEMITLDGCAWPTTWGVPPPDGLRPGRILTTSRVIATPSEKHALHRAHDALAVDMESAYFARRCTEAGLRFGCIRAVSDEMSDSLSPQLVALLAGSVVSPWRFLLALLRRPRLLPETLRLARHTKQAAERLVKPLFQLEVQ